MHSLTHLLCGNWNGATHRVIIDTPPLQGSCKGRLRFQMASHTNQATWSDHDPKWNHCDSIWNQRKGGNVEVILDQKDLGITSRLRRTQGRPKIGRASC